MQRIHDTRKTTKNGSLTCLGSLEKTNMKSVNTTTPRALTREPGLLRSVSTSRKITTVPAIIAVTNLQLRSRCKIVFLLRNERNSARRPVSA